MNPQNPAPFLDVLVHDLSHAPAPCLTGLCAGYEAGKWRHEVFARHLIEWLPEFALTYSEREAVRHHNALYMLQRAAQVVYQTEKYSRRGEFGEILLHAVLRQVFNSIPAISKLFYKSASNETVKGFDAVHIIENGDELELWLGEVKFYSDIKAAISDVVEELNNHTRHDYLRGEFALIINKIDNSMPQAEKLKQLLHPNTSLDVVFSRVCIPVLLTYNSTITASFTELSAEYKKNIVKELKHYHGVFASSKLPTGLRIHLFLIPLKDKKVLVDSLHSKLVKLQEI